MDFAFTEAQTAVAELARKIFQERLTPAAHEAVEASEAWIDRGVWAQLATSGLLGTAIAEAHGGGGQGFLELCALLQEAGAAVAPLPLWATLVLGAMPIEHFGTEAQKKKYLPRVATGEAILTAALAEPDGDDPMVVRTTARATGGGWVVDGVKTCVPSAAIAERILVPAVTGAGTLGVFLVDPKAAGVKVTKQVSTTGEPLGRIDLAGAVVGADDVLGEAARGAAVLEWLLPRATVALCALELGVCERALAMTATYTAGRQQFERPIATFQAVSQRAADAYIDVEAIRVATWQAAWRLANEVPVDDTVSIAKFFAAEAGHRVVFAAQHLHGGMGFDVEYPLYRHYLLSKQIELTLGSASAHLAAIGRRLAAG
jgi:alkylation response protein AidB-like acyl-CoA dehydrogenase